MASDVTALLLATGEPFVERALASLERQTQPPVDVVRVDDVSPFHRAFNAGMSRVRSEFFVQVDADMILDLEALADLRAAMAEGISTVIGGLRDPLRGSIVGVKLFRSEAACARPCADSITPAVDFIDAMGARGWMTSHAIKYRAGPKSLWHTFGEHQPDYAPDYTFAKFRIIGARYRRWRRLQSLQRMFTLLHRSQHPAAISAQIGTADGLFWAQTSDALTTSPPAGAFARLEPLLEGGGAHVAMPPILPTSTGREAYVGHYRAGCEVARLVAGSALHEEVRALGARSGLQPWLALLGLCRGVLAEGFDLRVAESDFDGLSELFLDPGAAGP